MQSNKKEKKKKENKKEIRALGTADVS